jgi:hypothetical protein
VLLSELLGRRHSLVDLTGLFLTTFNEADLIPAFSAVLSAVSFFIAAATSLASSTGLSSCSTVPP